MVNVCPNRSGPQKVTNSLRGVRSVYFGSLLTYVLETQDSGWPVTIQYGGTVPPNQKQRKPESVGVAWWYVAVCGTIVVALLFNSMVGKGKKLPNQQSDTLSKTAPSILCDIIVRLPIFTLCGTSEKLWRTLLYRLYTITAWRNEFRSSSDLDGTKSLLLQESGVIC